MGCISWQACSASGQNIPMDFFWTGGGFEYPLALLLLAIGKMIRAVGERSLHRHQPAEV